ncbi:MAG TPA: phage tail protein, partial [Nitrospira sp.]|nr:phage tail protein [Nitrospira sp.]
NAVRSIPSVVGGIPINIPTATEWSGGSYFASLVDIASVQVAGDVRGVFVSGRRVKVYPYPIPGTVSLSEYDGRNTTISIVLDFGSLDNTVVSIAAATLSPAAGPMPERRHIGTSTFLSGPITIPAASGMNLVPVGLIRLRTGSAAPGWLQCNGQAVSRTTYALLFAAIGTAFGAGNGTTTFNVPTIADSGASHYWIYAQG